MADAARLESLARRAYEGARLRRAFLFALPLLPIAVVAGCLGGKLPSACCVGALAYAAAVAFLWRGRELGEAVLPGVVAGVVPLTLALCAKAYGHVCTGEECVSLCVPACTLGGVVAGAYLAILGRRRGMGLPFWLAAGAVATAVGTLGCSCVGYGGVLGLVGGLLVPQVAAAGLRLARR